MPPRPCIPRNRHAPAQPIEQFRQLRFAPDEIARRRGQLMQRVERGFRRGKVVDDLVARDDIALRAGGDDVAIARGDGAAVGAADGNAAVAGRGRRRRRRVIIGRTAGGANRAYGLDHRDCSGHEDESDDPFVVGFSIFPGHRVRKIAQVRKKTGKGMAAKECPSFIPLPSAEIGIEFRCSVSGTPVPGNGQ
jgi:hypothetical protein